MTAASVMNKFIIKSQPDDELMSYFQKLRSANDLAPISILSDDILLHMFSLLSTKVNHTRRLEQHSMKSTSQVCHRWRIIAVNSPTLWNQIDYVEWKGKEAWFEELWRRSRQSLVQLSCLAYPYAPLKREYIARLKGVDLCITNNNMAEWNMLIERPGILASQLETLTVIAVAHCALPFFLELPEMEPRMKPPRLRKLRLSQCMVDLNSLLFSNLTLLSIFASDTVLDSGPTVAEWLAVLRNMPSLTKLFLRRPIPVGSADARQTIDLPKLQYLELTTDLLVASDLVAHLRIPPSCALHLRLEKSRPGLHLDALLGTLRRHAVYFQTVNKMQGLNISATLYTFSVESDDGNHMIQRDQDPDIRIHFTSYTPSDSVMLQAMSALAGALWLSTTSLSLHIHSPDIIPTILPSLYKFKAVTNIFFLQHGTMINFMPYMAVLPSDSDAVFPCLEAITIYPAAFTSADYQNLVALVRERQVCPFTRAIKQIRFIWMFVTAISVTPTHIEALEQLGVHLKFFRQKLYILHPMKLVWTDDRVQLIESGEPPMNVCFVS